jgi:hypothetical protein
MIGQNTVTKNNSNNHTVLKIKPVKFKELLSAFELNINSNSITVFTKIAGVTIKEKIIYAEKSALEIAFEEFQDHEI